MTQPVETIKKQVPIQHVLHQASQQEMLAAAAA